MVLQLSRQWSPVSPDVKTLLSHEGVSLCLPLSFALFLPSIFPSVRNPHCSVTHPHTHINCNTSGPSTHTQTHCPFPVNGKIFDSKRNHHRSQPWPVSNKDNKNIIKFCCYKFAYKVNKLLHHWHRELSNNINLICIWGCQLKELKVEQFFSLPLPLCPRLQKKKRRCLIFSHQCVPKRSLLWGVWLCLD